MTTSDWYDWLEKIGSLVNVTYDSLDKQNLPKHGDPAWVGHVKYPDGTIQELWYGSCLVDPLLRDIVLDLCVKGWYTCAGCQGKTELKQFGLTEDQGGHSAIAYLSFEPVMPTEVQDKLKSRGLQVYMEGRAVTVPWPEGISDRGMQYTEEEKRSLIEANRAFPDNLRWAFQL